MYASKPNRAQTRAVYVAVLKVSHLWMATVTNDVHMLVDTIATEVVTHYG